jgi:hypothetical protein
VFFCTLCLEEGDIHLKLDAVYAASERDGTCEAQVKDSGSAHLKSSRSFSARLALAPLRLAGELLLACLVVVAVGLVSSRRGSRRELASPAA